jgi:hypothetical protein
LLARWSAPKTRSWDQRLQKVGEVKIGILIPALLLAGCGSQGDERICSTAPTQIEPGDMMAGVHKWAYRLARSDEPAEVVARAVARACNDVANYAAERSADKLATQVAGEPERVRSEAYTGNMALARTEALFRVIQARAGDCNVP